MVRTKEETKTREKSWLLLAAAIGLELCGTTCIKLSEGFTQPIFVLGVIVAYSICFTAFSIALRDLPLGLAYGVWGGIGTIGTAIIGFFAFGEPMTAIMTLGIVLIIAGVAFMNAGTDQ